ncbi:hypothetical protein DFJ43DRAFT_1043496 [Lentinula guzmanii]|uniref:Uncharacterized protein n=1 Tax=Lentinula guzmanii TaxID=2804957 RepID=A0AA38JG72_9AGAR|nr:hypothetical protein DFJ43DRAFT_1043496 [Lentinula guzmanii]
MIKSYKPTQLVSSEAESKNSEICTDDDDPDDRTWEHVEAQEQHVEKHVEAQEKHVEAQEKHVEAQEQHVEAQESHMVSQDQGSGNHVHSFSTRIEKQKDQKSDSLYNKERLYYNSERKKRKQS